MEMENNSSTLTTDVKDEEDTYLPGFRFYPTDEELVGYYLRKKVEKIPISIELIKHVDIYKYDPWDLPKLGGSLGESREWYFFCKRGRKYKNSIRPNRVTSSGFWKATGIDKPIYGQGGVCIGLKKSLVYYRGSAGKGTKTDWMMHEFRLPASSNNRDNWKQVDNQSLAQEAEVWTLCRIFKRNVSYKKCVLDIRGMSTIKKTNPLDSSSKSCVKNCDQSLLSFNYPDDHQIINRPFPSHADNSQTFIGQFNSVDSGAMSSIFPPSCLDGNELLTHADWGDLRAIVDCSANPFSS